MTKLELLANQTVNLATVTDLVKKTAIAKCRITLTQVHLAGPNQ